MQAMLKKFKYSKKVWMRYHDLVLGQGDGARAAELLKRSLQSLAKHKHVAVISHFAQVRRSHEYGDQSGLVCMVAKAGFRVCLNWLCSRSLSTGRWIAVAPSSRDSSPPTPGTTHAASTPGSDSPHVQQRLSTVHAFA